VLKSIPVTRVKVVKDSENQHVGPSNPPITISGMMLSGRNLYTNVNFDDPDVPEAFDEI